MKEVSAEEVRNILRKRWPGLKYIWNFDRKLMLLPMIEMKQVLKDLHETPRFRYEVFDCDDFALVTHAFVKLSIGKLAEYKYNAAFGEALISSPGEGMHVLNIFISDDETVWFFDAQLKQMEKDYFCEVLYVRF